MPNYTSWNKAIAQFFTANVPRGSSVFLTLNDDALREISANFLEGEVSPQDAAEDFVRAVCAQVVTGNAVSLTNIAGRPPAHFQKALGFWA